MARFTLVLFPDESRALRGLSVLERLHREGSICVRGAALLERDEHGLLLLRKDTGGMLLVDGLGAVVARAPGPLLDFLARDLAPNTFALVAEVRADRSSPVGAPMERLGGVVREWSTDHESEVPGRRTTRCA